MKMDRCESAQTEKCEDDETGRCLKVEMGIINKKGKLT